MLNTAGAICFTPFGRFFTGLTPETRQYSELPPLNMMAYPSDFNGL
jgi:hypothetical protein